MNKPNILVFCSDEEQHLDQVLSLLHEEDKARFLARLKTRTWFREHGVSFDNHHGTSIPCTSARGVMWTGHHAPDTQLVDNMEVPYQISLGAYDPTVTGTLSTEYGPPTLGHMLDALGYYAAFHGKVHLAQDAQLDSTDAMWKRYGFHDWTGTLPLPMVKDMEGTDMGHLLDPVIAEKAVNWLHDTAPGLTKPWALVVSFINPHDTMLVDIDGKRSVQKMQTPSYPIAPSPYREWWNPKPPPNFAPNFGVQDTGPRPQAHDLWASICSVMFGNVPFGGQCEVNAGNRKIIAPMWQAMINHYLNCIIDNDEQMWKVLRAWLLEPGLAASRRNTVLLLTSDHGDMMMSHGAVSSWYQDALGDDDGTTASSVWMPLRQKGPFIYRENYRLPLVIASPSTDYVPNPGSRVPVLSNHLDLVPTLLGYAGAGAGGKSIADWYWQTYGAWLKRLAMPIGKSLCGFDLGPVAKTPSAYPQPQWGKRTALLFTYDTINTLDPQAAMQSTRGLKAEPMHFENRACMRGLFDGRHKFVRYFSPLNYAAQANAQGSYASLTNPGTLNGQTWYGADFVLYDTQADPTELRNRITDAGTQGLPTLDSLNAALNSLQAAELTDPARMPLLMQWATAGKPWITSVSPKGGPPGETVVTLSGPGLQNRPEVYFKGLRSLKVTQNSDGSLSAAVPLGAEDGPITVRTAAGSHSSYTVFDVRPG